MRYDYSKKQYVVTVGAPFDYVEAALEILSKADVAAAEEQRRNDIHERNEEILSLNKRNIAERDRLRARRANLLAMRTPRKLTKQDADRLCELDKLIGDERDKYKSAWSRVPIHELAASRHNCAHYIKRKKPCDLEDWSTEFSLEWWMCWNSEGVGINPGFYERRKDAHARPSY
jgi:hypothetical protein